LKLGNPKIERVEDEFRFWRENIVDGVNNGRERLKWVVKKKF
jgi:hypothetical protein